VHPRTNKKVRLFMFCETGRAKIRSLSSVPDHNNYYCKAATIIHEIGMRATLFSFGKS